MKVENPERLFEVHVKDPAKQHLVSTVQALVDFYCAKDEVRDMLCIPRKGREPDYLYGRWCIKCHNSLPEDWGIKPCDVCGAATGFKGSFHGLLGEWPDESTPIYGGVKRASDE